MGGWIPNPKKLNVLSPRISHGMVTVNATMIWLNA